MRMSSIDGILACNKGGMDDGFSVHENDLPHDEAVDASLECLANYRTRHRLLTRHHLAINPPGFCDDRRIDGGKANAVRKFLRDAFDERIDRVTRRGFRNALWHSPLHRIWCVKEAHP